MIKDTKRVPGNKGLDKTDTRVAKYAATSSRSQKGKVGHSQTAETRAKISAARKKYIKEHPDQVPFKMHHSSAESYPESYFRKWLKKEKLLEAQELQIDRYTLDFAWPDKKIYLEIDGNQHKLDWMQEHDKIRTEYLADLGGTCIGRVDGSGYKALCTKEKHKYLQNIKTAIIDSKFVEKFISKKDLVAQKHQKLIEAGFVTKDGRVAPQMLTKDEWQKRFNLIINSGVDLSKFGGKEKVIKITGLSLRQITDVIEHFYEFFKDKVYIRGITIKEIKQTVDKAAMVDSRKQIILGSNIDFTRPGGLAKLSRLLNISHQSTKKGLVRHMPDFYSKCYKK